MATNPWERESRRFRSPISRLFEELLRDEPQSDVWNAGWIPLVDIVEHEGDLVVKAELPGVSPDSVDVHVENGVLTIRGERPRDADSEHDNYIRIERPYGRFVRSFTLPSTYDVENIRAELRDGILRIEVPRSAQARPRRISIHGGEAAPRSIETTQGAPSEQPSESELVGSRS